MNAILPPSLVAMLAVLSACGSAVQAPVGPTSPSPSAPVASVFGNATAFLYARQVTGTVIGFGLDQRTGAVRAVMDARLASGMASRPVADPLGRFLYVVTTTSAEALHVDAATGALAASGFTPLPFSYSRSAEAGLDPAGRFAYVTETSVDRQLDPCLGPGLVRVYSIGEDGAWTVLPRMTAITPAGRGNVLFAPARGLALISGSGDPTTLYGPCAMGGISTYAWSARSGSLSASAGSPFAVEYGIKHIAMAPSGAIVYTLRADYSDLTVASYRVDEVTGAASEVARVPVAGAFDGRLLIDPSGRFLVAAAQGGSSGAAVTVFRLAAGGGLELAPGYPSSLPGYAMVLEPQGRFVYFTDGQTIDGRVIDPATAALSKLAGFPVSVPGDRVADLTIVALPR